jgi:hypothetical protein
MHPTPTLAPRPDRAWLPRPLPHPLPRPAAAARTLAGFATVAALAACGGGEGAGGSPPAPPPAPVVTTTVSGTVAKGPVANAQVCAYAVAGSARGAALGTCTTTDAGGRYRFTVPAGSGLLWLEATGGTYTDEATGATTSLPSGSALVALATANGSAQTGMLTPLTTLALNAARANVGSGGTLDAAAHAAAVAQLLAAFGLPATLDIATSEPVFGGAIDAYGTALTVISRMVAAGLSLDTLLATPQPSALAAAYAAAAAPPAATTSLVITAAHPAAWNGTLNADTAQYEHGSGAFGGGPYDAAQPYCRVAVYGLVGGDGTAYFIEVPFSKADRSVGLVVFGLDATLATLAREAGPLAGVSIDTVNRRITFTDVTIGTSATDRLTLNGTISYPTNIDPANRAACG